MEKQMNITQKSTPNQSSRYGYKPCLIVWHIADGTYNGTVAWEMNRDSHRDEQDKSQKDLIVLLVQSTNASIALGEATARAVQRIPDAHCNGDMHTALEYATSVKHKQKDFLTKQGVDALLD